jgi:hypothetical protein
VCLMGERMLTIYRRSWVMHSVYIFARHKVLISSNKSTLFLPFRRAPYNMTRIVTAILYAFLLGCAFLNTAWREGVTLTEEKASGLIGTIFLSLNVIGTGG